MIIVILCHSTGTGLAQDNSEGQIVPPDLTTFMERQGEKPYELFWRQDGSIMNHRAIFNDSDYDTEIWMLDTSPISEHSNTASYMPAWNADGSRMNMLEQRPFEEGMKSSFLNADYSRFNPVYGAGQTWDHCRRQFVWSREDPDVYFQSCTSGQLIKGNFRSGDTEILAEWEPFERERIYGLTTDHRYIWFDTPNGGIWLTYDPGDDPVPPARLAPGRPGGLDRDGNPVSPRKQTFELMHRSSPTRKIADHHEDWGHIIKVRTGMLLPES